eukprot:TRINITY_DN57786_c0_g1_i1.p1 TRINITY_DN57786_c0_g1~~TRINITY_DN57786_c0_g1_i1.p1  ORF type:complete len:289 (-),score=39.16 TRINITY_DN57786_c0_g1_i1:69-935(-)
MGTVCSRRDPAAGPSVGPLAAKDSGVLQNGDSSKNRDPWSTADTHTGAEGKKVQTGAPRSLQLSTVSSSIGSFVNEEQEMEKSRWKNHELAAEKLQEAVPEAVLTKMVSINGRLLFVVDRAINETIQSHLFSCLQTDAFKRTEFARQDTREFRHHIVEYNPDKLRRTELYAVVDRLVQLCFPPAFNCKPLDVYRIYTNSVMYGDVAFPHRDSCDENHITVIVYPNPEWKCEFGGETIFYDESGEIAAAIEPRPGRVAIFQGCIMHKGSPPSRLFWGARYTTAFKFSPE